MSYAQQMAENEGLLKACKQGLSFCQKAEHNNS